MRSARGAFPSRDVKRRERSQRRRLNFGLAALLVLATAPLFAHHVSFMDGMHLGAADHLLVLCLTALHSLLEPVHVVSHLLFAAGLGYAIWDRAAAWWGMRRTLGALESAPALHGADCWEAARATGVDPRHLRIVQRLPSPAFTVGWLQPRIYLAADLSSRLSPAELRAVIAHEGAHLTRRDPFRLSTIRFLSRILFWIPAFASLAREMEDEAEIQADDFAAREDPLALASAILRLAAGGAPPSPAPGGVGFNRPDLLERRIRRLAGEDVSPPATPRARGLLPAAVVLLLLWSSGATVLVHPESPGATAHCEHHDSAVSHLLCPALAATSRADDCPHRHHG
jgi:Zn-dependent protease with chaperone function